MRRLLLLLAACEPHLIPRPLPELVPPPPPVIAIVTELNLPPGETLIWDVHAEGLSIGRAEWSVGEDEVHTTFATNELASMFSSAHDDLYTHFDRAAARPLGMHEVLEIDGQTHNYDAPLDGHIHTIHTALGWLRAWAHADAPPAVIAVAHAGEVYKVEIATPVKDELHGETALRIDGHAGKIAISIWLSDTTARVPLRIVARTGTVHVDAELVSVAREPHVSSNGTLHSS